MRKYQDRLSELSKMWDEMLRQSIQVNQSLQKEGIIGEELSKKASENKKTSTENGEVKNADRDLYSYDTLIQKPDIAIIQLPTVTQNEFNNYRNDTSLFAKDMRNIATNANNEKNTATSTYLYNIDLKSNVLITKDSYKHGAGRFDINYVAVCKALPDILKNAIVVNELSERADTNGSYVMLGLAENSSDYSIVRLIVNKKTWKLDDYKELYAIKKKTSAKSLPNSTQMSNKGQMSSTISISDFLLLVNSEKLGSSVLSNDVIKKLGNQRLEDKNITPSLKYSDRDLSYYSYITGMQTQLNEIRATIRKIEASEEFKAEMNKLSKAVDEDNVVDGVKSYQQCIRKHYN